MLRLSLDAELAAAAKVAAKVGLGFVEPQLLHLGNHTTVRLAPWPIVARIASGTSFDFSHEGLSRELMVARHLASHEAPAVRPATGFAAGPYLEDDCAITLWDFVEGRAIETEADEMMAAASLQRVHAALADFEGELPSFLTKIDSCKMILADPAEAPKLAKTDRLFLEKVYAALRQRLNQGVSAWRPLHGDTHLGNALVSGSDVIWMDLEAACVGPLEWDVVNQPARTWPAFDGLDAALMNLLADVRSFCVSVWCWAEFDRSAASAEAAIYHLHQLEARFS